MAECEPQVTMVGGPPAVFGTTVRIDGAQALLSVRGPVDLLSVPELAAILDAVITLGYCSVVLDLHLGAIDASGLRVIANATSRLVASGGELTIRGPSVMGGRTFDVAWLTELVRFELPELASEHLGPEQSARAPSTPLRTNLLEVAHDLRRVSPIPADDDAVDGALRLVVALARATVGGADGVSVSLRRHGRLATVAASDQTISATDADQYATGEGPCVDASVEGRWFHAESLAHETRWPPFTPRAQALGINAILSSPLLVRDRPAGALNIYSRSETAFAAKDQELASVFATEASIILTDAGVDVTDDQRSSQLGEALRTRQIIAQAQGVIMEREAISEDNAYSLLRNFSRRSGRPLRERAEDVVASTRQSQASLEPAPVGGDHG